MLYNAYGFTIICNINNNSNCLFLCVTGKAYYKIEGGQKRMIPNWDTFTSLKIPANEVLHMESFVDFVPTGAPIPPVP